MFLKNLRAQRSYLSDDLLEIGVDRAPLSPSAYEYPHLVAIIKELLD